MNERVNFGDLNLDWIVNVVKNRIRFGLDSSLSEYGPCAHDNEPSCSGKYG